MRLSSWPIGFGLRTNDKFGPHLYWHSPHSLTWSWILRVHPIGFVKPSWAWHRNPIGLGGGIPRVIFLSWYHSNNGIQWQAHFFGLAVSWSRQRPMWFRDMYRRAMDKTEEAERQLRLIERFAGIQTKHRQ